MRHSFLICEWQTFKKNNFFRSKQIYALRDCRLRITKKRENVRRRNVIKSNASKYDRDECVEN